MLKAKPPVGGKNTQELSNVIASSSPDCRSNKNKHIRQLFLLCIENYKKKIVERLLTSQHRAPYYF